MSNILSVINTISRIGHNLIIPVSLTEFDHGSARFQMCSITFTVFECGDKFEVMWGVDAFTAFDVTEILCRAAEMVVMQQAANLLATGGVA